MKQVETRKALETAISRIRRGVPKVVAPDQRMCIAAVAREAGVSNATIHNRYPDIAEMIRKLAGGTEDQKLGVARGRLKEADERLSALRKENAQLRLDLQRSQSINFRLLKENELLRKNPTGANVLALRK